MALYARTVRALIPFRSERPANQENEETTIQLFVSRPTPLGNDSAVKCIKSKQWT